MRKTAAQTSFRFNSSLLKQGVLFFFVAAVLAACVSAPPYEEYTLAREALRAAEEADSAKYSPGFWLNAESTFRNAEQAYKLNQFDKARIMFIQSRQWSEKAENQTRLKKFESGDVFQ